MSYSFVRTNSDVINYGHISAIDGVSQLTLSFWYQAGDDGAVDYCGVMSQINGVNGLSIDVQNTDDASLIYAFRGGSNKNFIRLTSPLTVGVWKHVSPLGISQIARWSTCLNWRRNGAVE